MSFDSSLDPKIPPAQWAVYLEKAADRKSGAQGGHHYIFLNKEGKADLTSPVASKTQANAAAAAKSGALISLEKIVNITFAILEKCGDPSLQFQMKTALKTMAERTIRKMAESKDQSENIENSTSVEMAKKILLKMSSHSDYSAANFSKKVNIFMQGTTSVQRSAFGGDGVYIVLADTGKEMVRKAIKPHSDCSGVLTADELFRKMGIFVPDSVSIPKNSEMGLLINDKLKAKIKGKEEEELQKKLNLAQNDYFLYTDYINGVTFGSLTSQDRIKLAHPAFIKELGKIILIDAVCGNEDRVNAKKLNPHNFMILNEKPVCIDNDYILEQPSQQEDFSGDSKSDFLRNLLSESKKEAKILKDIFSILTPLAKSDKAKETFSPIDFARYAYPDKCGTLEDSQILIEAVKNNDQYLSDLSKQAKKAMREGIREAAQELLKKSQQSGFSDFMPEALKSDFNQMMQIIKDAFETTNT